MFLTSCGGSAASTTTTGPATTVAPATPSTSLAGPDGNHVPTASIDSPRQGTADQYLTGALDTTADPPGFGSWVAFAGTASDPDGDAITVEWFSSVEGPIGTGEEIGPIWFHVEGDSETRTITMRVTDAWGAWIEVTRQINIFIPSDT
jgi:hypothetical protein